MIGYTMVGHRRLDNIRTCIEDVLKNDIPGDLIETGVWRGGYVIVDDYFGWKSCRKAVTEFRDRYQIEAEIQPIDFESMFWQVP